VSLAQLEAEERIAEARFAATEKRLDLRERQRLANLARQSEQRRLAQVDVDITDRLDWPEALQQTSLASLRSDVEAALRSDRGNVHAGSHVDVAELRRHTTALFAAIRPQRDELGDHRLLAAKHYLEGLVRAAEDHAKSQLATKLAVAD
jgi:hypothetical protein